MKKIIISMFVCLTAVFFMTNLQAQQLKTLCPGNVSRSENVNGFSCYESLMCVYLSEMGYYRNEESKNDCRSGYLILSADSLQVYHGMVCENDKGYEQYLPQKQSSRIFTFRRSGYIPQYVLEELDKGNVVSVASLGKRKYIVQSFSR